MIKKSTESGSGSELAKSQSQKVAKSDEAYFQSNLFLKLALDMTWQLAIVVIVPIVGGYFLDNYYHSTPWFPSGGFILAAIGVVVVLRRVVTQAGERSGYPKSGGKK